MALRLRGRRVYGGKPAIVAVVAAVAVVVVAVVDVVVDVVVAVAAAAVAVEAVAVVAALVAVVVAPPRVGALFPIVSYCFEYDNVYDNFEGALFVVLRGKYM